MQGLAILPDKQHDLHAQLIAFKTLSQQLLEALSGDLETLDDRQIKTLMTQREALLSELGQHAPRERQALKRQAPDLLSTLETLNAQCIQAVQAHAQHHNTHQQQMNQGRHLLQAYQHQDPPTAHFIEGDA